MSEPRFSVVIPTKDRTEVLPFAVRTCLLQDRDDFEIVIADNCSQPAVSEVLGASDRIRILPAERPLPMTDNWERAVRAARGEWIVLLGDDDGLLPGGLNHAEELARQTSARAVRWSSAYYTWPNFPFPEQANYLRVPLGRTAKMLRFTDAAVEVLGFRACYSTLPMLYNSMVHRSVIDELIRRSGRVFAGRGPDVYSGFAVGHVVGEFVSCDYPLSIAGASGKSTGIASNFVGDGSAVKRENERLNDQGGYHRHPECPDVPVFPFEAVMDAYLFARDALFPDAPLPYDRLYFLSSLAFHLRALTEEEWHRGLDQIRRCAEGDATLAAGLADFIAPLTWSPPPPPQLRGEAGYDGSALHLNAEEWGVRDVEAAARLTARLLGAPRVTVEQPAPARPVIEEPQTRDPAIEAIERENAELRLRLDEAQRHGALRNVPGRLVRKLVRLFR